MKKVILLFAGVAFTTASFAQTAPTTEVKVRDNGTKKVVTTTGKTNVGQALENTVDAAGNVAKKAGKAVSKEAKKVKHSANKKSKATGAKLRKKNREIKEEGQ